jgi:Mg-chelatase subunit ChlD
MALRCFFKTFLTLIFFAPALNQLQAQITSITISPAVYRFGEIHNWKNPPAIFTVTNRSNQPLMFLPLFPEPDVLVELPTGAIAPGTSAAIKVFYYTSQPGVFDKTIQLYVNLSSQPLTLKLEGEIMSFNPDALISCPGFAPKTFSEAQSFIQEVRVIDKLTRHGIEGAAIRMVGNNQEYTGITNNEGIMRNKIMLGLHDILISMAGYRQELRIFYLTPNTGVITVEMKRDTTYDKMVLMQQNQLFAQQIIDTNLKSENIVEISFADDSAGPEKPATLPRDQYSPNNIVFLIDASASMKTPEKLPLLKHSMKYLLNVLRDIDKFSLVTYSSTANVVVSGVASDDKERLSIYIDSLRASGYTNGVKGIETAYILAEKNYFFDGNNQIILATDGLFNSPEYDKTALMNLVKKQAGCGIRLSVVAFGNDTKAHQLMKKLARYGQGNFIHITPDNSAVSSLVEEIKLHSAKK